MSEKIHPTYLPYSALELAEHMPPVGVAGADRTDRWLQHFLTSADNEKRFHLENPDLRGLSVSEARRSLQVDKDERFWIVTTMMRLIRHPDAARRLTGVLTATYGETPLVGESWETLLNGTIHLFFEAALPSPPAYKDWLATRVDRHPVRYVRNAARRRASDEVRRDLEGRTNVDALVVVPETGFGLVVEAKVLSDVSAHVTFDPVRNQVARNIDVMLEANLEMPKPLASRDPQRTFFLLVTPQLFVDHPTSRLYGWLMPEYLGSDGALRRDLPHRSAKELDGVSQRMGWTSWEQIATVWPNACPWLTTQTERP